MSARPQLLSLGLPRLTRVESGRALGGVAAGIAAAAGVDATLVRLVFALLSFASGAGILAYLGGWLLLPLEGAPPPTRRRQAFGIGALVVAFSLALRGFGLADSLVWPVVAVAAGITIWRSRRVGLPPLVGAVLIVGGVILFVTQNAGGGNQVVLAPGAVTVGVLVVVGPWLWRLARERDAERSQRIRTEERAELASRVHDSVLQTLALIQRESGDARAVATLARRQERELRGWLYPDAARLEGDETLSSAIEAAATEVEELHGVRVELVRTGDCRLDERLGALVLAAREAMANAAKHSGVDEVAVYVDVEHDGISVFVRDRGAGFAPAEIGPDRQGIAESIRGRMERAGGEAVVTAAPGEGTEIELRMARSRT
ncbi:MAG TPA: PspC domain-containing protein [Gaiellaceae bacterium]|nr:PspC domain-containing protein [Gaiellaceae bacterium]